MKKAHKFISFAAVALQLLSFLCFFVVVIFQRQFKGLMSYDPEITHYFTFPIAGTLNMLLLTLAVLLLCAALFFKGRNIVPELLCIALLVLVCPFIARIGNTLETSLIAAPRGTTYLASYSALSSLLNIATGITDVASALALIACGMGIALKKVAPKD